MLTLNCQNDYSLIGFDSFLSRAKPDVALGHRNHTEFAVSYYRARYYDPATGRFLSEDPIMFGGGDNFHLYAGNDPVDLDDPFGMCPQCGPDGYRDVTPEEGKKILQKALPYQGTPYKWGGKTPAGFDCSGFVCYVLQNTVNPDYLYSTTLGMPTNPGLRSLGSGESPQPGDVMLFPDHAGFYDPSPPNPGQSLFSPRGSRKKPGKVDWGNPKWWPGPRKYFRPRVPCSN